MTNLQKRNQLSGLVHKLRECKNDFALFYKDEHVSPPGLFLMSAAPDNRSEETKMICSKLERVHDYMRKTILGLEQIRDIYSSKAVADLCHDISEDGMIEINGHKYQLVEVIEY